MAHPLYSGNADDDCYSDIAAYTTGSYYDVMKESAFYCIDKVLEQCMKAQCPVVTLADFGTGDGVNFLKLLKNIVLHVDTKSRSTLQILAYLEDQPANDFNLLHSKYASTMGDTLDRNLFYATVGKTMYSQCLPSESVNIAFSSAALHWLSKTPCNIKDGFTTIHADVHERELFRKQAKEDWKTFLLSRGTELKPGADLDGGKEINKISQIFQNKSPRQHNISGGFMVLTVTISSENDAARNLMLYTSEVWRKMFINGKISKGEYEGTTLGFYVNRTEEDIRQPFNDSSIRNLGLRIVSLETRKHELVPLQRIRENSGKNAYAAAVADVTRPILRNILFSGLSVDRTAEDKNKIIENFFAVMTDTVNEGSDSFDFFILKEIVVTKE